jgi:hypothetical protein
MPNCSCGNEVPEEGDMCADCISENRYYNHCDICHNRFPLPKDDHTGEVLIKLTLNKEMGYWDDYEFDETLVKVCSLACLRTYLTNEAEKEGN